MSELALFHAAERGDLKAARAALDTSTDPNTRDDAGSTALHVAAHGGYVDIVDVLLVAGAVVDMPDALGCTPLHLAAGQGHVHVVRRFVTHKANVLARTSTGETPLHKAAAGGHGPVIEILLAHGADPHAREDAAQRTPLHLAAMGGHLDAASGLITGGADTNAPDAFGQTPLWLAASQGQSDVIDVLLGLGADLNAADQNGETPLMAAVVARNTEVVRSLLAMGANPNLAESRYGLSPLHVAATNGDDEIADLLVAAGADVSATDQAGLTAADAAVEAGHRTLAERLRGGESALAFDTGPPDDATAGIRSIPLDAEDDATLAGPEAPLVPPGEHADWQARGAADRQDERTLRFALPEPEPPSPHTDRTVRFDRPQPEAAEPEVVEPSAVAAAPEADFTAASPPEEVPVAPAPRWSFALPKVTLPRITLPTIDVAALLRPLVRAVRWLLRVAALAAVGIALVLAGPSALEWIRTRWPQDLAPQATPAPPPRPKLPIITSAVNDFADVLDVPSVRRIGEIVHDIKRQTGIEVTVVTVASPDPLDIAEYAEELARQWLGPAADEQRLLLLLAVEDGIWRVWMTPDIAEMPGRLPIVAAFDLQASWRIERGNYRGGLVAGVEAVGETLARHRPLAAARRGAGAAAPRAAAPAAPRPPAPSGLIQVTIDSRPSGATVRIDGGAPRGATPLALALTPGPHHVELQRRGHVTLSESIRVHDANVRYVFDLVPVLD
jgi:ankyrin repeat protein